MIQTEAFVPDPKTAAGRGDGGKETSVNWEDDSQVENFTLKDTNAQYGAARLLTSNIVRISGAVVAVTEPLTCERQRLPKNKYHGNIVYSARVHRPMERMLAAALALNSSFVPALSEDVK